MKIVNLSQNLNLNLLSKHLDLDSDLDLDLENENDENNEINNSATINKNAILISDSSKIHISMLSILEKMSESSTESHSESYSQFYSESHSESHSESYSHLSRMPTSDSNLSAQLHVKLNAVELKESEKFSQQ